ncbi:trigger factor [Roseicitreum antarcticum]|uniref:Trigger factor n=1 Tax=Roseicitreum antarcticum TaxID=564137 RepID=A0A1H2UPS9_9RHOB|nr:trigger factor [Roseicitreum antarcticum]SDW57554.1 trigger factor [Roseicitreum antarcticum]
MQVTETLNEGLKRGYTVTVTAAELDAKVNDKLVEAQPGIEMKGFRKGKVPMALLKKQFGPRVLGEAMQEAVDSAVQGHFEATGDRPAMQPQMEMTNQDWKEGQDVTVALTYEALPDIGEPDLSGLKIEKLVAKAEDAAVTEALENLAKSSKSFADKEGAAETGDQVTMNFLGKVDGEPFEGGSAEDFPLEIGSGQFIPGFEEQLVGVSAGDEKSVPVTFPEEYGAANLAGKEAVFDCTIKAVKAPQTAEINDDLAKQFGADDLDALKAQITERLEAEYAQAARAVLKRNLLDQLDDAVTFDLPPSLVEAEANQIAHQLWHDENPDVQGHDHPEITPTEEHTKLAVRRVKLGLLLAELGRKAEVEVTDQEMTQAVIAQARQYPGQERQFFEFIQKNAQMQQQLRAPIFEDKVIDHIVEQAKVTEKTVTKEELQAAVEALDETETETA